MSKLRSYLLVFAIVAGAVYVNTRAQTPQVQAEGGSSYTPSKLEWITLLCNVERLGDAKIKIEFQAHSEKPNTILASIVHSKSDDARLVKYYSKLAKETPERIAKKYGWQWLEVEVQTEQLIESLGK